MTTTSMLCVVRDLTGSGDNQYVSVSDVFSFVPGETLYQGEFNRHTENHGPSGSHQRAVCLPVRGKSLRQMPIGECVLRTLDGEQLFVPAREAVLVTGETKFVGVFSGQVEGHGPSGSHRITVCTPVSRLTETTVH